MLMPLGVKFRRQRSRESWNSPAAASVKVSDTVAVMATGLGRHPRPTYKQTSRKKTVGGSRPPAESIGSTRKIMC